MIGAATAAAARRRRDSDLEHGGANGEDGELSYLSDGDEDDSEAGDGGAPPELPPASQYGCLGRERARMWLLLEYPRSSVWGRVIAGTVMTLVVVSAAVFCLETLPQYHRRSLPLWVALEVISMLAFTAEYAARALAAPQLRAFVASPQALIDLLSFLPFYVELALRQDHDSFSLHVARMLRLLRLLRLFKISRYSTGVKLFGRALADSTMALQMMALILSVNVVFFAAGMYTLERGEWDDERHDYYRSSGERSPFNSIPASFWWAVVTLATVGYGDDVPVTAGGKLVATAAIVCGIVIVALPVTIIGLNFAQIYQRSEERRRRRERRRRSAPLLGGSGADSGAGAGSGGGGAGAAGERLERLHRSIELQVHRWAAELSGLRGAAGAGSAGSAAATVEMGLLDDDGDDDDGSGGSSGLGSDNELVVDPLPAPAGRSGKRGGRMSRAVA